MRNVVCFLVFAYLICACDHPEARQYARNQGIGQELVKVKKKTDSIVEAGGELQNKDFLTENKNVLKMEIENGVRYVWIEINGIHLRFIFDTGASSVCISPAEATVLFRQGTLRKDDILDVMYYQDATGRISEGTTIILRDVKVGSLRLENVKATVIDNLNAPLLLGQSVLERFGRIEIDNNNNEIIFK